MKADCRLRKNAKNNLNITLFLWILLEIVLDSFCVGVRRGTDDDITDEEVGKIQQHMPSLGNNDWNVTQKTTKF